MRLHYYLLFLTATAFACQTADTSASAKQAIDAANAQWARLTSTGHADSIAEFFTADAIIMPPNMATMKGKDAIRTFFATLNTMDPKPTLTVRADAVHGAGAMAMERGRWHWVYPAGATLPPGMPGVDSGKYVVHWMQQNGKWLMVDQIWNSDLAPPMMAPPPPPPAHKGR
jgi:ketosteroid isomerase-like protein